MREKGKKILSNANFDRLIEKSLDDVQMIYEKFIEKNSEQKKN